VTTRTPGRTEEVEDYFSDLHFLVTGDPGGGLTPFVGILLDIRVRLEYRRKCDPSPRIGIQNGLNPACMVGIRMRKQNKVNLLHP
jgi:hypothetical protein